MIFSLFLISIHSKQKNRSCLFSSECIDIFNNNKMNNNTGKESIIVNLSYTKELPILRNNNKTGLDERFLDIKEDDNILTKIDKYYYKSEILGLLQNNSITIWEKIRLFEYFDFEKESIFLTDFSNGGLFHDWDNEIF